jgi:hypothetical protein
LDSASSQLIQGTKQHLNSVSLNQYCLPNNPNPNSAHLRSTCIRRETHVEVSRSTKHTLRMHAVCRLAKCQGNRPLQLASGWNPATKEIGDDEHMSFMIWTIILPFTPLVFHQNKRKILSRKISTRNILEQIYILLHSHKWLAHEFN